MDDKRGLRETPFAICRNKNTWKNLQNTVLWCNLKLAQQRGLLYQTRSDAVVLLWHTACRVHWESGMHENWRTASSKRERKTTCCAQSKFAVKKQDHLLKHKAKCEASGRPHATSWTTESQAYLSQRFKSRMNKMNKSQVDREVWIPKVQGTNSSVYEPDAEDQQVQRSIAWVAGRHESNRNLRALRQRYQASAPGLQIFDRSWDHLLQMRTKSKVQSKPWIKSRL